MKNISNLDDLLSLNEQIISAHRSYFAAIITILVGCLIIFAGTFIDVRQDALMLTVISVGIIAVIYGIFRLFSPASKLIYTKTGEPLKRIDIYYDLDYDGRILHDIKECSYDKLRKMANNHTGRKLATVYSTKSGKMRIAQIFKFEPYEYRPFTDPIVIM